VLNARHPRVLLNVAAVGNVEKLVAVGADEITDVSFDVPRPDLLGANPAGRVVRSVLLIERGAIDPVRKAFEDQRVVEEMRDEIRRDFVVVVDDSDFSLADLGPEDLVQVGEFDFFWGTGARRISRGSRGFRGWRINGLWCAIREIRAIRG